MKISFYGEIGRKFDTLIYLLAIIIIYLKEYKCPAIVTIDIFNDRWKIEIIWFLREYNNKFKELSEDLHEISQKILTINLKELEEEEIKREIL